MAYIKGNLAPGDAARLQEHLAECDGCRKEYEATDWLLKGLTAVRDEIRENHLSSTLLYHFIQSPRSLDADTTVFVRTHLDLCDRCRQDAAAVRRLSNVEIENIPPIEEIPNRPAGFWRPVFRIRLIPAVAAAAIAILLVAWIVSMNVGSLPLFARVVSHEEAQKSGYSVVNLINDITTRGDDEFAAGTPTVVIRSHTRGLVLTLEAVTFGDEDVSYGVVVTGLDGNSVWQSKVTADQLESGSLWLIVDGSDFEPGTYRITVFEQQDGIRTNVSTAHFEIRP